ncbi:hypothetical protein NON00_09770 [Roseomonas sp. GC11]|uniref:hypothetical protein n=1 Tax=Roseomonas sp. GC11 TaxID=2950546 RepID=UPI00210A1AA6|nr:hypothetical protein [Roseomonas sp. GC11]MCQ4160215.1 hypothetical protein [Roseomonas sp. GC11]
MTRPILSISIPLSLALCAPLLAGCVQPQMVFEPSSKPATELRAAQVRLVPVDADAAMRGAIAALHDLGYRITKVEPDAGTVSATRMTTLRMAVVVRARTPQDSVVRANATIVSPQREAQVDSAEFYEKNFYTQLAATLQRELAAAPAEVAAPEALRPTAELNTLKEREAAARAAAQPAAASPAAASPATGAAPR